MINANAEWSKSRKACGEKLFERKTVRMIKKMLNKKIFPNKLMEIAR